MQNTIKNFFAITTLGAALFAITGATPVLADRYNDLRSAVRHDLDRVDNDQKHLRDLNRRLDSQRYHSNFRAARRAEDAIDLARIDLQRDRDNLRIDQHELDKHRW